MLKHINYAVEQFEIHISLGLVTLEYDFSGASSLYLSANISQFGSHKCY